MGTITKVNFVHNTFYIIYNIYYIELLFIIYILYKIWAVSWFGYFPNRKLNQTVKIKKSQTEH